MDFVAEIKTKHGGVRIHKDGRSGDVSLSGPPSAIASIIFGSFPSSRRAFLRSALLSAAGQTGSLDVPLPLRGQPDQVVRQDLADGPWPDKDYMSESYASLDLEPSTSDGTLDRVIRAARS